MDYSKAGLKVTCAGWRDLEQQGIGVMVAVDLSSICHRMTGPRWKRSLRAMAIYIFPPRVTPDLADLEEDNVASATAATQIGADAAARPLPSAAQAPRQLSSHAGNQASQHVDAESGSADAAQRTLSAPSQRKRKQAG
jgi:hypothetical protein